MTGILSKVHSPNYTKYNPFSIYILGHSYTDVKSDWFRYAVDGMKCR